MMNEPSVREEDNENTTTCYVSDDDVDDNSDVRHAVEPHAQDTALGKRSAPSAAQPKKRRRTGATPRTQNPPIPNGAGARTSADTPSTPDVPPPIQTSEKLLQQQAKKNRNNARMLKRAIQKEATKTHMANKQLEHLLAELQAIEMTQKSVLRAVDDVAKGTSSTPLTRIEHALGTVVHKALQQVVAQQYTIARLTKQCAEYLQCLYTAVRDLEQRMQYEETIHTQFTCEYGNNATISKLLQSIVHKAEGAVNTSALAEVPATQEPSDSITDSSSQTATDMYNTMLPRTLWGSLPERSALPLLLPCRSAPNSSAFSGTAASTRSKRTRSSTSSNTSNVRVVSKTGTPMVGGSAGRGKRPVHSATASAPLPPPGDPARSLLDRGSRHTFTAVYQ